MGNTGITADREKTKKNTIINSKPFFSILIPVFNTGKYLPECLASVQAVSCTFEIIVVDDGSTDNSMVQLKKYQSAFAGSIRCIQHPENAGLYEARRTGVKNASGEYLVFLDSDDALMPGALDRLYHVLEKDPVDILGYGFEMFPMNKSWSPDGETTIPEDRVKALLQAEKPAKSMLWNKVYRAGFARKIYDQMTPFYANNGEDIYQSALLIANAKTIRFLPDILYKYRYGSGCSTRQNLTYDRFEAVLQSLLNVYRATADYFNQGKFHGKYEVSGLKKRILHDLICEYILIMMPDAEKDRAFIRLTSFFEADLLIPYLHEARTRHDRLIQEDDCFFIAAKIRNTLDSIFPPESRRRRIGGKMYSVLVTPLRGLWHILHKIIRSIHPHSDDIRKQQLSHRDDALFTSPEQK